MILQDDRNTALRYRSAANFLCLAAPLVEPMPDAATTCDMDHPVSNQRRYGWISRSAHEVYDSTPDGFIDRAEFDEGLKKLMLRYDSDSLDLTDQQAEDLVNHIFSQVDPSTEVKVCAGAFSPDDALVTSPTVLPF